MSNQAPYCNVTIAQPPADPSSAKGLQRIPPGATIHQITNIVNQNFFNLVRGNFNENRGARQTVLTRIYDPSDHNVYVDVRQITGLQFINSFTGQTINWSR